MLKYILVAIVIIGAITQVAPIRDRVMPPLSRKLGPVLGPPAAKVALPVKKYRAKTACTNLLRELVRARTQNKPIPEDGIDFYNWAKKVTDDVAGGTDPWGSRYFLKPGARIMAVGSPGPDGRRGNGDDIVVTIPWE